VRAITATLPENFPVHISQPIFAGMTTLARVQLRARST
jgi:hypothetical protein